MVIFQFANCKRLPEAMAHQPTQVETSLVARQTYQLWLDKDTIATNRCPSSWSKDEKKSFPLASWNSIQTINSKTAPAGFRKLLFPFSSIHYPNIYIYIYIYYSSMSYKDFFLVRNMSRLSSSVASGRFVLQFRANAGDLLAAWEPPQILFRGKMARWRIQQTLLAAHFWDLEKTVTSVYWYEYWFSVCWSKYSNNLQIDGQVFTSKKRCNHFFIIHSQTILRNFQRNHHKSMLKHLRTTISSEHLETIFRKKKKKQQHKQASWTYIYIYIYIVLPVI